MAAALLSSRMLLLHTVALVCAVGAFALGVWQIGAWKEGREDTAAALRDVPAVPLDEVLGADDPFPAADVGRPVTLTGTWLPEETVFVAGKTGPQGDDGYWVVTPVRTSTGSAVAVVRGWSDAPEAAAPAGAAEVTGWLQPGEGSVEPDADPDDDVLPSLRTADLLQRHDQDLYGGYVIAERPRESGLVEVTPEQLPGPDAFTSIRNLLYGIEWWVFGGFAVFLWWRWCRDELDRVRSGAKAADQDEPTTGPEVRSGA